MAVSSSSTPCPACGAPGTGRFCSSCGAPRDGAPCASCGTALSAGAKFCHRCGLAVGSAPMAAFGRPVAAGGAPVPAGATGAGGGVRQAPLPWAIAFVSLLALFAFAASNNFGRARGGRLDAPLNALPQAGLGDQFAGADGAPLPNAPFAGGAAGGGAGGGARAVDLSSMTPREIADRLFDRIMAQVAAGKADSAQAFAQMALQHYASMDKDLDLRYDMGRVAEVTGSAEIARAQADTILREAPTHLLGLVLAAKAAALQGRMDDYRAFQQRLVAAAPAERAKKRDEYERHANDIDAALKTAPAAR
ncbi:MAG TPA: zinc ribbon domain-containing protein [Gemmatirosa sp.]|nr:zinc ribbon domain-containing protein [Gemmatirosa sp.]